MPKRYLAYIAIGLGICVLLNRWGDVADWASQSHQEFTLLASADVKDWSTFCARLGDADAADESVGRRIWNVLDQRGRDIVLRGAAGDLGEGDRARLVYAVNEALSRGDLLGPPAAQVDSRQVQRINRSALQAAFGDCIDWSNIPRTKRVSYWTASGSPEWDLWTARRFMELNPDVVVVPNFRETGGLQDVIFISFLSGNPPDLFEVNLNDVRDYVAAGMVRPMDDLLERQLREEPNFLTNRLDGEIGMVFFRANPNDRFFREMDKYPREAARLLEMHGKLIGFRNMRSFNTLTYNKRLFREAAKMFPNEGLVDPATGEPVPPATWAEMLRIAKVITEYGRQRGQELGLGRPVCYGVVLQGRTPHDVTRGIKPLAETAGTSGFDFAGDTWCEAAPQRRVGRFVHEENGTVGALKFVLLLKQADVLLPGTESRPYEDVRSELARGNAAMLIDGWHAALIGSERVPWAKKDLGSAPVPVPDEATEELLGMKLHRGRTSCAGSGKTTLISSVCPNPYEAWRWMMNDSDPKLQQANGNRGSLPGTLEAAERINDPAWHPLPFQAHAFDVIQNHTQAWPDPPVHRPIFPAAGDIMHTAFYSDLSAGGVEAVVEQARQRLAQLSRACNEDLFNQIALGEAEPSMWTFEDWDPLNATRFYHRQRKHSQSGDTAEAVEKLRAQLAAMHGDVATRFEPTGSPYQVLWIAALLVAPVAAAVGWRAARPRTGGVRVLAAEARQAWPAYIFVLPGMLALVAFVIYPSLYQLYLAMHSGTGVGPLRPVGLANFRAILGDTAFWKIVIPNTAVFMVSVTALQICLALLLAHLLVLPMRANRAYRLLFFIPLVTSLVAVSVVFLGLLAGEKSGLNQFLQSIGLADLPYWLGLVDAPGKSIDWLGDKRTDLAMVIAVSVWHGLPYTIILIMAGLQSISPDLYDAAKVDGANAWRRFSHVTIPELLPILGVIVFNSLIGSAKAFAGAWVLTGGGKDHSSELVSTYIYKWGFTKPPDQQPDLGYAAALGIAYSLLLGVLVFANVYVIARRWRRRLVTVQ